MLRCYRSPCNLQHALENYLSHRYDWCCMVRIERLHSQQFVFSQPRFVAVLQKLAMEAHKPSCQLAEKKWISWNAYSEKKLQDGKRYMSRWKWAGTVVKRENVQKMDPKFWVLSIAHQFIVSPQRHTHFYKNMWFYEHGFRSGGMFLPNSRSPKLQNFLQGHVQILFPGPESLDVAVPVTLAVAGHVPKHVPKHVPEHVESGAKLLESTECFQHRRLNMRGGRVDLLNRCLQGNQANESKISRGYPNEIG